MVLSLLGPSLLLLICCLEGNDFRSDGGDVPLHQVIDVLGVLYHHLVPKELPKHLFWCHILVLRIFMNQGSKSSITRGKRPQH
jgi:hypothetical protein